MSTTTDHWRWSAGIIDCGGYGICHGDTFYQGKRNYDSVLPCPNGLKVRDTQPRDHEAWRRRVAKARGDIATSEQAVRIAQKAELITDDCFDLWLSIMTGGLNV